MSPLKPLLRMIRINVTEVLSRAEEERKNPAPLPSIRVVSGSTKKKTSRKPHKIAVIEPDHEPENALAKTLWAEFSALKNERNRLSTEIAHLVENGADQSRLKAQYDKIESFRPQLQEMYDKIQYVEKHGELPTLPETEQEPETLASLKLKKESLIDERYKLRKKLAKKVALNPQRFIDWELRLAQADIEFQTIIDQIKQMEGKV